MRFKGIKPEGIELLAINRFNDSKTFYDENKNKIKEMVTLPLRDLLDDLFDTLVDINPDFILDPVRCISRVRRDTRFTHDKSLYRENLWMMFRHQKNHLPTPMMWFEFSPEGYNYGCGIISGTPAFMEYWRKAIKSNPAQLDDATACALSSGAIIEDNRYKRSKAEADGIDGVAAIWYDQKAPFVIKHIKGVKVLNQPKKLVNELSLAFKSFKPLYDFMLSVTTSYNSSLEVYNEEY